MGNVVKVPPDNPWVWSAADYQGRAIRITVPWNASNKQLLSATVEREPGCLYGSLLFGVGEDGAADSSLDRFPIPEGTTTVPGNLLRANRLKTIDDILSMQITAGL
jgi:hypothetical protein